MSKLDQLTLKLMGLYQDVPYGARYKTARATAKKMIADSIGANKVIESIIAQIAQIDEEDHAVASWELKKGVIISAKDCEYIIK